MFALIVMFFLGGVSGYGARLIYTDRGRTNREGSTPIICTHDWANWSDPQESPVKIFSLHGYSGTTTEQTSLMQSRLCLKCNLHERKYV